MNEKTTELAQNYLEHAERLRSRESDALHLRVELEQIRKALEEATRELLDLVGPNIPEKILAVGGGKCLSLDHRLRRVQILDLQDARPQKASG